MIYELNLCINNSLKKAYFENLLMNENNISKIIHNHKHPEIHTIIGGDAEIFVGGEKINFRSGMCCIIPGEEYHYYLRIEPKAQIISFQINMPSPAFLIHKIPENIISEIITIIKSDVYYHSCCQLQSLLSYIALTFSANIAAEISNDYAIAIYDFISKNYNQHVTLVELSENLHLSKKQTERLVKKHMGCSFKIALINRKMLVADFLENNTKLKKKEIANYVGYANYSGYLKAKNEYKKEKSTD